MSDEMPDELRCFHRWKALAALSLVMRRAPEAEIVEWIGDDDERNAVVKVAMKICDPYHRNPS